MTDRAYIIGAGGFGRELLDWLKQSTDLEFAGFLDDGQPDEQRLRRLGALHVGGTDDLRSVDGVYFIGVGAPDVRQRVAEKADGMGAVAGPAIIHPSSVVGSDVMIGDGSVVCPGVSITTNIRIGRHVHLNLNATVGHDTVLYDYVTVNPGATISGDVTLQRGVMIGTNAAVNQGIHIGARSVLGSGAAAVRDIPADAVAVGVPARPR